VSPPGTASPRAARGFDRLAPVYDALATAAFAGRIHASQIALLPRLPPVRRALVMGGGAGRFLAAFLGHDPQARAVSIDLSPGMTRRTAVRLGAQGLSDRAELRTGGLEALGPDERFDLVVTHCFLDLFTDPALEAVIDALSHCLEPGGHWLFSDFDVTGTGVAGLARRSIVAMLYQFFRATCAIEANRLPGFDRAFERAGLKHVAEAHFCGGLLRAAILRKPEGIPAG